MAQADRCAGVLRPTRDLLAAGRICPARARLIADMLVEYDDSVAAAVQARVLPRAPEQTWGQLRSALARAIIAVVPDPACRHRAARKGRRVELWPGRDGMATLAACLSAPEATASYEWITRLARGIPCDPAGENISRAAENGKVAADRGRGSMDRRRADVLVALLTGRLVATSPTATSPAAAAAATTAASDSTTPLVTTATTATIATTATAATPTAATAAAATAAAAVPIAAAADAAATATGVAGCGAADPGPTAVPFVVTSPVSAHRPLIHVTVPLTTLMGLDDEPGELAGYGPIPASLARQIAADPDGTWRRLLTDPVSGTLLDYGRRSYRPPAALACIVRARDSECRYPGCRRPAVACELDHVQAWQHGGTTSEDNLCALCERHHDLKEHLGWQVVLHPDRAMEWITPTGHHYWSRPVDHRPSPPLQPPEPDPPDTMARRSLEDLFDGPPPEPDDPPPF